MDSYDLHDFLDSHMDLNDLDNFHDALIDLLNFHDFPYSSNGFLRFY